MMRRKLLKAIRVPPGRKVDLDDYDPGLDHPDLKEFDKEELKEIAAERLRENVAELAEAQELLYASDVYSLLIVLQAMDAAGKDGTIKHVMSGVNPQGCQVFAFKKPSDEDLDHNFLWRYMRALPERGRIGIFNRSYYEDVLVVKVHPELLGRKLPPGDRDDSFWKKRYDDINRFEHHLVRNGTVILKFFLNVSKKAQKQRFLERLENPEKHWKFSEADLAERDHWDAYRRAFEDCFSATSTKWAPWYIIPADHKWAARALVSGVVARAVKDLDLAPPPLTPERKKALAQARRKLMAE